MSSSLLLTGASGLLGRHLLPRLADLGEVTGLGGPRDKSGNFDCLDLADPGVVSDYLDRLRPSIIVHAAAMTDVDACEREPFLAYKNNVVATQNILNWCSRQKATPYLAYISTDQVYDGIGPHEESLPSPINVYGLSKLWAEGLVQQLPFHLILRLNYLALPLTDLRRGFVAWLIDNLSAQNPITLFDDVLFNPLYATDAVELLFELLKMRAQGLLNLGASGAGMSKASYGLALAEALGLSKSEVKVGSVAQVSLSAARPRDMRMNISELSKKLGRQPPDMQVGLQRLAADWRLRNQHMEHA
jgi:dTDP-4-dehydrorhamnose reductase